MIFFSVMDKLKFHYFAFIGLLQFSSSLAAQEGMNSTINVVVSESSEYQLNTESLFTSMVIKSATNQDFSGAYISIGQKKWPIRPNHVQTSETSYSNLIVFDSPVHEFKLFTGNLKGSLQIVMFDARRKVSYRFKQQNNQELCEEPNAIDQSQWRAGLPEPSYNRLFTEVNHQIVHHSATSNSLSDYENVVRNIYLFHTQERGWSDIGYNYLIAPDGLIYKGRDPAGGNQDDVLGAHFCGTNSGTMGICMLGTYISSLPSDEAMNSLKHLLTWKAKKESLEVMEADFHPSNPVLPIIAGHRDGCATECPGSLLYQELTNVRINVANQLSECVDDENVDIALFPNPVTIEGMTLIWPPQTPFVLNIYDLVGRLMVRNYDLELKEDQTWQIKFSPVTPSGIYFISVKSRFLSLTRKIMLLNN